MTPTVRLLLLLVLFWVMPKTTLAQTTSALPVAVSTQDYYTVRPGDNLWVIADANCGSGNFNLTIAKLNRVQGPKYIIHPNDVLVLPSTCKKSTNTTSTPAVTTPSTMLSLDETAAKVESAVPAINLHEPAAPFGNELPTVVGKPFNLREFFSSPRAFAHVISRFIARWVLATGYCPCEICTSKPVGHPLHGRTALGDDAYVPDGVAAAFEILPDLPRRARVIIPGYGVREVDDTGGDMRRDARRGIYHIDVRFRTHSEAKAAFGGRGKQWVLVQILKN